MAEQEIPQEECLPLSDADADDDPWFREETRVPDTGPPYPEWSREPLTPQLLDTARDLLHWIIRGVWGPATYALQGRIWQWKKFEVLEWLRPLELLLRRMLLIEAFALIASQTLPRLHGRGAKTSGAAVGSPAAPLQLSTPVCTKQSFDAARPETWRVAFTALPGHSRSGPRRSLPPVQPDRQIGEEVWAKRYRRRLVSAVPLARRLEAVIRVINDPLPFVRRLAFKLSRGRTLSATRLIIPRARPFRFARDALYLSGNRGAQLADAYWSSG